MKQKLLCSKTIKRAFILLGLIICGHMLWAQESGTLNNNDNNLIKQYILSKRKDTIVFDASNIKQFWVDNSIFAEKALINVLLYPSNGMIFSSIPLKIKLANTTITHDCKMDIVLNSSDSDLDVEIQNKSSKTISEPCSKELFLNHSIISTNFHLDDTPDLEYYVVFKSKKENTLSINGIYISFADNSNFLVSPGRVNIKMKDLVAIDNSNKKPISDISEDSNGVSIMGVRSLISSSKKFLVNSNTLSVSLKVKNIGDTPMTVAFGYAAHLENGDLIQGNNYPYKNINKILKVISSSDDNKKIIVDAYSDWEKGCFLSIDAKEDMSDVPNAVLIDSKVLNMKQIENDKAEIELDLPSKRSFKKGDLIRIHGFPGYYLYKNRKLLQPGEEAVFSSSMQKDDSLYQYTASAFSHGAYYAVPVILSYSEDSSKANTILINDFTISY